MEVRGKTEYKVGSLEPAWTVLTEKYLSQISCLSESTMYSYRLTRTELTLAVMEQRRLGC
jgi:hypothetical protein